MIEPLIYLIYMYIKNKYPRKNKQLLIAVTVVEQQFREKLNKDPAILSNY